MQNTGRMLLCLHRSLRIIYRHDIQVRHRSITGHMSTDAALRTMTGGRVDRWMQMYEDFVGLTEVKEAQNQVLQAEKKFLAIQEERRHQQQMLETVQSRLRAVSAELEKTNPDTLYLDLVQREHAIIREENNVMSTIRNLEKAERESFALLSSALRDSHEKERARTEKMKYWSIMGSIVGAIIGITGTTINNYIKMKELRSLVSASGENSEELKNLSIQLCEAVSAQSKKMDGLLVDLHASVLKEQPKRNKNPEQPKRDPKPAAPLKISNFSPTADDIQRETEKILAALKSQEKNLDAEIQEIRRLVGIQKSQSTNDEQKVVYVGPEVQTMMRETEENLERKIKYSALASATFVYGAIACTIPIIFSFFRGGT